MNRFVVTIIRKGDRAQRHVIAHSSSQALRIALNTLPDSIAPFALICKKETQ